MNVIVYDNVNVHIGRSNPWCVLKTEMGMDRYQSSQVNVVLAKTYACSSPRNIVGGYKQIMQKSMK